MTAQQTAKLSMYNAVISQLTNESAAINSIPALKKSYGLFVTKVVAIKSLSPKQEEGSIGETITKDEARMALAEDLIILANQITAWASDTNNAIAKQKAAFSLSDFTRMKGAVLPNEAEALYEYAVANKAALSDYGVTEESLDGLVTLLDNYTDAASLPRNKISTRKTHGQNLETLFAEADKLLNEQIKKIMSGLKKKYPDMYSTFVNNSRVVDVSSASAKTRKTKIATTAEALS